MQVLKERVMVFLIFFVSFNCYSQGTFDEEALQKVDSYFNQLVQEKKIAGVVTLFGNSQRVEKINSMGFSDIADSVSMSSEIVLPIASMTKIVTSVAILQLNEKGLLDIDDPIAKYLPQLNKLTVLKDPNTGQVDYLKSNITIRHLLTHTSGLSYGGGNRYIDSLYNQAGFHDWNKSLAEFITVLAKMPLAFEPGDDWMYGYSHDVLGYLIEKVSGYSLAEYFSKYIFEPLGMTHTHFFATDIDVMKLSNLYKHEYNRLFLLDDRDSSMYSKKPIAFSGGGGWWNSYCGLLSSIDDFYCICAALLGFGEYEKTRILSRESVESMISNQIGDLDAYGYKYGLGIGLIPSSVLETKTEAAFWAGSPVTVCFYLNYEKDAVSIFFANTASEFHMEMINTFMELSKNSLSD